MRVLKRLTTLNSYKVYKNSCFYTDYELSVWTSNFFNLLVSSVNMVVD